MRERPGGEDALLHGAARLGVPLLPRRAHAGGHDGREDEWRPYLCQLGEDRALLRLDGAGLAWCCEPGRGTLRLRALEAGAPPSLARIGCAPPARGRGSRPQS